MKKICYVVTKSITIKAFFIPQLKFLAENGYDVSVVCSPDEKLQELLGDKIKFIPLEMPRGLSVFGSIKAIKNLKNIFKKEKFDLVQYSTPNAAFYASIASKKTRVKVRNYHLMGFRFLGATGLVRVLLKWIEKKACKNSTSIECVSKSNIEIGINEKLFDKNKATVVWNGSSGGVDLERFDETKITEYRAEKRKLYDIKEDEFVFGFVGRVTRDKGIEELISAFSDLEKENPKIKLAIIGGLDENNNLSKETLAKMCSNDKIISIDATPLIEKIYPMLDVLVLPSYREGFGNVVIEAEAMGVPVLVSNIAGPIDAMIDGVTGLTFASKNVNDLIKVMREAPSFKEKGYCKNAIEYVKNNFDSKKLCEYILERKDRLLAE